MEPPNPFIDVSSDQLSRTFTLAAQDLSEHRPRTRDDRVELASRIRLLLLAGALRLVPAGSWFARPEPARTPKDFFPSLRADHAQRLRELRYRALLQAAEHRLGPGIRDATRGEERVYDLALSIEDGLNAALLDLSQMRTRDG